MLPRFQRSRFTVIAGYLLSSLLVSLPFASSSIAQSLENGWVSHTPFRSVKSVSVAGELIWAATSGGVFSYNNSSGEISTFTTTQGLHGINASSIITSADGSQVWVGYDDGVIDLIDTENGSVESFLDISRAQQFSNRGVRRLSIVGDSLFVASDFGLIIFDSIKREVRDSFTRFGDFDAGIAVNDFAITTDPSTGQKDIVVATISGLASAPFDSPNLKEPGIWSNDPGLLGVEPQRIGAFAGELLIGTNTDIFLRGTDLLWRPLGISDRGVKDFVLGDQSLFPGQGDYILIVELFAIEAYFLDGSPSRAVFAKDDSGASRVTYLDPIQLIVGPEDRLWLADTKEGLARLGQVSGSEADLDLTVIPEGPFNGLFTDMEFDTEGTLWASGTASIPGNGFHSFNGTTWNSFTLRNSEALVGRAGFDHINVDDNGGVWAGSAGFGLALRSPDGSIEVFDETNSTLQVAAGTPSFVRVRGIASESGLGTWVLNRFSTRPINLRKNDGIWEALPALVGAGLSPNIDYDRIYVDSFRQKWIRPLRSDGIIIWDSGLDPIDNSDDRVVFHRQQGSSGTGLPNRRVTAWAEDLNGRVWIGTERGIAFYFSPSSVFAQGSDESQIIWPINEAGDAFLLRDVFVNDLAVDPANQLWIATQDGAWLIDETGSNVLQRISTENSPLLSDNIISIEIDGKTGDVFFATDVGVQSWRGNAIDPSSDSGDLFVYPNPVIISEDGESPFVTIEGLVGASNIRIVGVDGSAVRSLESRGGRTIWDAKDQFGEYVPSGIYLVVSSGTDGEGVSVGKVAVVR